MKDKKLEIRMYFFVPYNISEIQKGIQWCIFNKFYGIYNKI